MTNWINKLELKDLWKAKLDGNIDVHQLAQKVAEQIKSAGFYEQYINELEIIVDGFKWISEDKRTDENDFDMVLINLYDFGDQEIDSNPDTPFHQKKKICWINTLF